MLYTYPGAGQLEAYERNTPDYMHPNKIPQAAIATAFLTDIQCDYIQEALHPIEPYIRQGCNAETREVPRPLPHVLSPLVIFARQVNDIFWKHKLDPEPGAWMQTYKEGGSYQLHTDASPGQIRKLTAVAMLTDPAHYKGGDLELIDVRLPVPVPRARGTVVVFPPWTLHQVKSIESGTRRTINLGFWGPPFR